MNAIARIDAEQITADEFVKILKFNEKFNDLLEEVMVDKLTVHAAKKRGISVSIEEVQERVDQLRRIRGLHRAQDTLKYIESLGLTIEEFERYITDILYKEKMLAAIYTDHAIEEYFRLHSPKFESIEISHIVLDAEGKAKEIFATLEDDPESFASLAEEHSIDMETKSKGGAMGTVPRGKMPADVEAKIFNAPIAKPVGPFVSNDGLIFEIFMVTKKHSAELDASTVKDIRDLLYQEWLEARAQEHRLEVM